MNKRWFFRYQNSLSVLISTLALNKAFLIFLQYVKAQWVKCTITCAKKMSFFFFNSVEMGVIGHCFIFILFFFKSSPEDIFIDFRERRRGKERERNID